MYQCNCTDIDFSEKTLLTGDIYTNLRTCSVKRPCIRIVLKYNHLCQSTITLASLVKGEVLSPEKIRATTGGIVTPPTLPKPHYPLLCTITLASLVKGRWIDGKAQALILLLSACDMPTIFMLQTFCRQDGGIAQQPFAPHNLPKPHYPSRFS